MINIAETLNSIKDSVLKFVPAKYIYLFGSYAYGAPTADSDIDVYIVTPDNTDNLLQLCGKIRGDLGNKKIYFIDLLLARESVFNMRKENRKFESTIYQKGKIIYEH